MDKKIVVCPYNVLFLINKKEQIANITDTYDRMEQSQKYYTEWKRSQYKRVNTARFHLYKTPEKINQVYNDRISGCLGQGLEWGLVWGGIGSVLVGRKCSLSWLCYGFSGI